MDDTAHAASAGAAPAIDDPLADTDPNPAYLAALAGALGLAEEARVFDLARAIANPKRGDLVSALLCHELASCHRLMMRFADVAGYSRMVARDEEGTLRTLGLYRAIFSDLIAEHDGRVFSAAGDSVLAEFASAVQSVRAGVAIQRALQRRNADLPTTQRMEFRVGINLGDVVADGGDLLGDGINVAARLKEVAPPAGICISGALREQTEGKLTFPLVALGPQTLKNIPRPVTSIASTGRPTARPRRGCWAPPRPACRTSRRSRCCRFPT